MQPGAALASVHSPPGVLKGSDRGANNTHSRAEFGIAGLDSNYGAPNSRV